MARRAPVHTAETDQQAILDCFDRKGGTLNWAEPFFKYATSPLPPTIAAVALDTNALKQFRRDRIGGYEALAYIEKQQIPLVVPGQAVQEYWNNHGIFVADVDGLLKDVNALSRKLERASVGPQLIEAIQRIQTEAGGLALDLEDSKNTSLLVDSISMWDELGRLATFPFVSRERFAEAGRIRFDTKTPPGFADDKKLANRLGDFYVWSDLLFGLRTAGLRPGSTSPSGRVILVTDDAKEDWVTSGRAHPLLMGEHYALTGRPLEIVGSAEFIKQVQSSFGAAGDFEDDESE